MRARPRDLADKMANTDEQVLTLPLDAARCKARQIIDQAPQGGLASVIEKWRQLPDGQIGIFDPAFSGLRLRRRWPRVPADPLCRHGWPALTRGSSVAPEAAKRHAESSVLIVRTVGPFRPSSGGFTGPLWKQARGSWDVCHRSAPHQALACKTKSL
jgi:hypothetical protein